MTKGALGDVEWPAASGAWMDYIRGTKTDRPPMPHSGAGRLCVDAVERLVTCVGAKHCRSEISFPIGRNTFSIGVIGEWLCCRRRPAANGRPWPVGTMTGKQRCLTLVSRLHSDDVAVMLSSKYSLCKIYMCLVWERLDSAYAASS